MLTDDADDITECARTVLPFPLIIELADHHVELAKSSLRCQWGPSLIAFSRSRSLLGYIQYHSGLSEAWVPIRIQGLGIDSRAL